MPVGDFWLAEIFKGLTKPKSKKPLDKNYILWYLISKMRHIVVFSEVPGNEYLTDI